MANRGKLLNRILFVFVGLPIASCGGCLILIGITSPVQDSAIIGDADQGSIDYEHGDWSDGEKQSEKPDEQEDEVTFIISGSVVQVSQNLLIADSISKIEVEDSIPGTKLSLNVFLKNRIEEDIIVEFAKAVISANNAAFERIFISYWLPGMQLNSGAWAISHVDPELQVSILGASNTEVKAIIAKAEEHCDGVLAQWSFLDYPIHHVLQLVKRANEFGFRHVTIDGVGELNPCVPLLINNYVHLVKEDNLLDFSKRISGTEYWILGDNQITLAAVDDDVTESFPGISLRNLPYHSPFDDSDFFEGHYRLKK